MSRPKATKEEQQLCEIRKAEENLRRMELEFAEIPKRLAREAEDRDRTIPPSAEVQDRRERRRHEEKASRGDVANCRKVQNQSILLSFLLLTATASLIWWGLQLMQR